MTWASKWTPPDEACRAFEWVGQAVCHCDACGHPVWEHLEERSLNSPGGPFDSGPREVWVYSPKSARDREVGLLRWKLTMRRGKYCGKHEAWEWNDISVAGIHARLTELGYR